ncbi:MAG: ImmA/IrrE family metallo-endopeptidase [Hyphomicrobiaceae bacterium]
MFQVRAIKSADDYAAALARVEALWEADEGTPEAEELDVVSTLIESYEDKHFPAEVVSPVDAIRFRMGQQGLTNRDLVPLIGSPNRVSEVLNGKRTLTLAMIRALHTTLRIPADLLIAEARGALPAEDAAVDWNRFPIAQLAARGWIKKITNIKENAEEIMRGMIAAAGGFEAAALSLRKKNDSSRRNAKMDGYALHAWCLHVMATGRSKELAKSYKRGVVNPAFLTDVVRLSARSDGPRAAQEYLAGYGIALVIAHHLPRTHLDGAVMMAPEGHPVIGMTLRHNRLDNFWFCLLHELAHIGRHIDTDTSAVFVDDLDLAATDDDTKEHEADAWAREASVPDKVWERHAVATKPTILNICALASELRISPAIVAGRVRRASNNYKRFSDMVGNGEVRRQFVEWK